MTPFLRRLRSLSRRDAVVAGGTLALVAVTVLAVFVFFPRQNTPRPTASGLWPGRAEQLLGPLDEVPAWQRGRVLVELRHFSPQTSAEVQVDSQSAGGIAVDASGEARGHVLLPAGVGAGLHQLVVQDSGTGNDAAARSGWRCCANGRPSCGPGRGRCRSGPPCSSAAGSRRTRWSP